MNLILGFFQLFLTGQFASECQCYERNRPIQLPFIASIKADVFGVSGAELLVSGKSRMFLTLKFDPFVPPAIFLLVSAISHLIAITL